MASRLTLTAQQALIYINIVRRSHLQMVGAALRGRRRRAICQLRKNNPFSPTIFD